MILPFRYHIGLYLSCSTKKNKKNGEMTGIGNDSPKTHKCECDVTSLTKKLIMVFHLYVAALL